MSLNTTPAAERIHIGIFGKRNAGKSSLINAITSQELAIVSEQKGTTTDPVYKAMELLPLGPVMIIDTPGLDDEGELGAQRIAKAQQVLNKCDIALLVVDASVGLSEADKALWQQLQAKKLPSILVLNKVELLDEMRQALLTMEAMKLTKQCFLVSALANRNINELKEAIAALRPREVERQLLGDLIKPCDIVVLVTPIDSAAPKGRLILPQQQVLRSGIDHKGRAGKRAGGSTGTPRLPAKARRNRQSGLRRSQQNCAAHHSAHILLHSHGALQGHAQRSRRGSACARYAQGWR